MVRRATLFKVATMGSSHHPEAGKLYTGLAIGVGVHPKELCPSAELAGRAGLTICRGRQLWAGGMELLVPLLGGCRRSWGPRVEVPAGVQPFVLASDEHLRGAASPRKLFAAGIDFVEIF